MRWKYSLSWLPLVLCLLVAPAQASADDAPSLRVMTWNIWHGGKEDGAEVGVQRVIEVIQQSQADVIAMQETYGSGEKIADALGYHFHPRGTNVSLLSRYPIVEDISVFQPFKCVGAIVELPSKQRVACYSIWLPYGAEIWAPGTRDVTDQQSMLAACQPSHEDLQAMWKLIEQRLSDPQYDGIPIVIAGDFNSMSHRDYIAASQNDYQAVVDWPTSHVLPEAGFRDAWRELRPEVDRTLDSTWTPRFPEQEQDRIDFIYYRGGGLQATDVQRINTHAQKFPSDHAAVVARFLLLKDDKSTQRLRTVSYNIRHGAGNDWKVDLEKTAALLRNLSPDVVGLQEVDNGVKRSGNIPQAEALGKQLGMHAAFGKFMDLQGGQYGMGLLSRHPIESVTEVQLPKGNEPRVALAARIALPSGQSIVAVNVHFDWVDDDTYRFAQAEALSKYLKQLDVPYILLGDFNDVRGSRTLKLLSENTIEAKKPEDRRLTWPSDKPEMEIDFIFGSPAKRWSAPVCRVLEAPETSDHCPVFSVLELRHR
ncbi:hypothetical protein Pan97_14780 [Bremerella volcania]|uniref:Endonuclease/exonuclease/phosphatase domain-containing protein n=1 Tax=Bremerella volcania TaxID=2527984 RepID=A0A518C5G4_9BACT|nr:endonuclease/exonuclease/phosphatase family protein [Bremerella volcania]QDU74470.1 hypothetical protein Pan97_14780 [Bremerella volcania]